MGSQHPTRACVPTPQYPCGLLPRAGAATQPDIRARWGARGRRNSPCQTGCWHMPSKRTAPWRWLGAVKTPEKSTKVGYHATPGPPCHHCPSLICSVLLGAFFQRDPRSQLSTGPEPSLFSEATPKCFSLAILCSLPLPNAPDQRRVGNTGRRQSNMMGVMAAA